VATTKERRRRARISRRLRQRRTGNGLSLTAEVNWYRTGQELRRRPQEPRSLKAGITVKLEELRNGLRFGYRVGRG
jgi:hypothetical protein